MAHVDTTILQQCIKEFHTRFPGLAEIPGDIRTHSLTSLIELYEPCYALLEEAMWQSDEDFDHLLDRYQTLFREQEAIIQLSGTDTRYRFILSIPVADRPAHLKNCLESIYQLCRRYQYGGTESGKYKGVKIIVAEDSRGENHVQQHIALVEEYRTKGLQVYHFGQAEQYDLLHSLPDRQRERLAHLLTDLPRDRFYLKGQAANRNLSYLKCRQLADDRSRTLYYMVDSDQAFCVNRQTHDGEQPVYALNYLHAIDRVFRTTDTLMLTGKLVGDPPVSPAVMAANFVHDIIAFFTTLREVLPHQDCSYHDLAQPQADDAAYHDMAGLFGFSQQANAFPYRCRIKGEHDHRDCLKDFCNRLNAFFLGEHLTRKTLFSFSHAKESLSPARTVYPGNYVVNDAGLKYIIPFGHLRLRMSGPTAGRLIAAEIGHRFASINLPHLHRRTSESELHEEFRPGVEVDAQQGRQNIDLSNEFERQFFGDLMLFTTEALVQQADIDAAFPYNAILPIIERKEKELLEQYQHKHQQIRVSIQRLDELVMHQASWWREEPELQSSLQQVRAFIHNILTNFSAQSPAWRQINSATHRHKRKQQIIHALMHYREERNAWDELFD